MLTMTLSCGMIHDGLWLLERCPPFNFLPAIPLEIVSVAQPLEMLSRHWKSDRLNWQATIENDESVIASTDGATQRLACLWRFNNVSEYADTKTYKTN